MPRRKRVRHSNPVGVPLLWQRLVSWRRLAYIGSQWGRQGRRVGDDVGWGGVGCCLREPAGTSEKKLGSLVWRLRDSVRIERWCRLT